MEKLKPLGQPFDPNLHEALFEMPSADHKAGTVGAMTKVQTLDDTPIPAQQRKSSKSICTVCVEGMTLIDIAGNENDMLGETPFYLCSVPLEQTRVWLISC